jgi:hypothetical protein
MEIPRNGRFQISLKWFFGLTLLVVARLALYPMIWRDPPIQFRGVVIGRLTSANDDFDNSLTRSEFEFALTGREMRVLGAPLPGAHA